ncbi:MAG: nitrogenase component I subunit alpha [Candidatus Schekmanbacteria bacterium]|nr:nitrogenase component I subunit alpha [Candidatus Schekmanbacteria bacterium]
MPLILPKCDVPIPERRKHILIKSSQENIIPACNIQTVPGDMTERGCAFAGCRGVVGGPIKDAIQLVHGPIGCAYYTWGTRRNLSDMALHRKYCFSTDLTEDNVVFGGADKLYKSIIESYQLFPKAKAVLVYATCVVGLIGDDLEAICKKAEKEIGIQVIPFSCEGFRGVSQSLGHHIANKTLFDKVVGTREPEVTTPYDMNIIGEYNIDGDAWAIKPLFDAMGIRVLTIFTGNASFDDLPVMHAAKLNIVQCQRSSTYIAQMIQDKYGTPFINVTLFGMEETSKALRDVGKFFGLEDKAQEVIGQETAKIKPQIEEYRSRLSGKRVMVFQGAPRAWHWIRLFEELGMEVVVAATTFGHKEDYTKIIERVKDGTLIVDNPNAPELVEILEDYQPDLFVSGLKEKYLSYKMGIPFVNGHSYEEGPYAGYLGFVNFARDMDIAINHPVWKMIRQASGSGL